MKKQKWILVLVLLAALVLSLAACGGRQATQPPEQPPAAPPTDTSEAAPPPTEAPAPTDTPAAQAPEPEAPTATASEAEEGLELDTASLSSLPDLDSYRATMRMIFKGIAEGQEVQQVMEVLTEYTREPLAQHIVISGAGWQDAEAGNIEMYRLGDMTYMNMGGDWISMTTPEDDESLANMGLIGPDQMLDDTCGWKKKGDTEYNGIPVEHWVLSFEEMKKCLTEEQLDALGDLTNAGGDLYVAQDGDYVVRMDLTFEGENLDLAMAQEEGAMDKGSMEFIYEMSDVNLPLDIVLPEEALASGGPPEDIPIPDDAQDVSNVMGMISFASDRSVQEIADFYKTEMPKYGWSEVSANAMMGRYLLEYSKDGRQAHLMIDTDSSTGKTSVLITVEESGG